MLGAQLTCNSALEAKIMMPHRKLLENWKEERRLRKSADARPQRPPFRVSSRNPAHPALPPVPDISVRRATRTFNVTPQVKKHDCGATSMTRNAALDFSTGPSTTTVAVPRQLAIKKQERPSKGSTVSRTAFILQVTNPVSKKAMPKGYEAPSFAPQGFRFTALRSASNLGRQPLGSRNRGALMGGEKEPLKPGNAVLPEEQGSSHSFRLPEASSLGFEAWLQEQLKKISLDGDDRAEQSSMSTTSHHSSPKTQKTLGRNIAMVDKENLTGGYNLRKRPSTKSRTAKGIH